MSRFAEELKAEGEDELLYIDEEDIDDLEDFEYVDAEEV